MMRLDPLFRVKKSQTNSWPVIYVIPALNFQRKLSKTHEITTWTSTLKSNNVREKVYVIETNVGWR